MHHSTDPAEPPALRRVPPAEQSAKNHQHRIVLTDRMRLAGGARAAASYRTRGMPCYP